MEGNKEQTCKIKTGKNNKRCKKQCNGKFVMQWHITHKCNLRCKHCYQDEYSSDLDMPQYTRIFNNFLEFILQNDYIGHINFTGGEPFANNDIYELLDLCELNEISYGILTNGTLIDEEVIKKLRARSYLSFVQVSIDGTKETHDAIRGEGNYNKAMRGLKLLNKVGIQTMVSFTAHKQNYTDLQPLVKALVKSKVVDRFWCDRLIPIGMDKELSTESCLSTEQFKEFNDTLVKLEKSTRFNYDYNIFNRHYTEIHINRAFQFLSQIQVDKTWTDDRIYQCSAGERLIAVLADGTIYPCRRLPIKIGNALEDRIVDIMQNNELIKELKEHKVPEQCSNCKFSKKCRGGAKCFNYAVTGDWRAKDPNCYYIE